MGKIINMNTRYQEAILKASREELMSAMEGMRDYRRSIDEKLDTLIDVIPSQLTEEQRSAHEQLIRELLLDWLEHHAALWCLLGLKEDQVISKDDIKGFLFPGS